MARTLLPKPTPTEAQATRMQVPSAAEYWIAVDQLHALAKPSTAVLRVEEVAIVLSNNNLIHRGGWPIDHSGNK
jgi:hypothetical protein